MGQAQLGNVEQAQSFMTSSPCGDSGSESEYESTSALGRFPRRKSSQASWSTMFIAMIDLRSGLDPRTIDESIDSGDSTCFFVSVVSCCFSVDRGEGTVLISGELGFEAICDCTYLSDISFTRSQGLFWLSRDSQYSLGKSSDRMSVRRILPAQIGMPFKVPLSWIASCTSSHASFEFAVELPVALSGAGRFFGVGFEEDEPLFAVG